MKKIFVLAAAMVALLASGPVWAQGSEKVSTMIDLRNDFIVPEKGENLTGQSVNILWQSKWIGGFLESDYKSKNHAFTIKSSLLFIKGPWYFLGGVSTNSQGSDFVQTGFWYVNNFGQLSVLLDMRNYWSITSKQNDYTDNLLRVMYPITDRASIGADLAYDRWWNVSSHNLYFIGPRLSYQLTKEISIYTRVSHEWDVLGSKTEAVDRIRVGLTFAF